MKNYNTTQLNPDTTFEKHVFHRDQFAHYLRWSFVLKIADIGMNILDFGCGSGNLAEVLYRNRYKANNYLGLDIRERTIEINKQKFKNVPWVHFEQEDLVNLSKIYRYDFPWDIITCFEVIEHVGKNNADKFLKNIFNHCTQDTIVLLSTPNFDERVGAAGNHTYDSGDGQGVVPQEFRHNELKELIEKYFIIEEKYGTFASIKDYKYKLNDWQKQMFDELNKYYDSNLLSVIMAPFFPEELRNCLWVLKRK